MGLCELLRPWLSFTQTLNHECVISCKKKKTKQNKTKQKQEQIEEEILFPTA